MLRGSPPPIGLPYPQKIHAQPKAVGGVHERKSEKPLFAVDSIEKGTNNVPHRGSGVLTEPPYLEKEPHGSHPTGLLKVVVQTDFDNKGFGY